MNETPQRLLLIDDDSAFRKILSIFLKKKGFEVAEAENGEEGIRKAVEFHPDMVILDVEMAKMSGVETLRRIKSDPQLEHLKVVFLTNYGEDDPNMQWVDKKNAKEIGAVSHIRKDDDLDVVLKAIRGIL